MKALVISGGGSKGAFAGGICEYLIRDRGKKYDLIIGTSTGSLMIPLLSIGEINKLKQVYTTVRVKDIFKTCPFTIKKVNGTYKTGINHLGILWMMLRRQQTFGDSSNLKTLIKSFITRDDYARIKETDADIVVTVSNVSCNSVEYKSIKEYDYEEFCNWIWISSNLVPFMSLANVGEYLYADGGIGALVPIHEAIRRGANEIDVIVLMPRTLQCEIGKTWDALDLTLKVFDFLLNQISFHNITIGKLEGLQRDVHLNFYYTPRILSENSLVFDPVQMSAWWREGYEHARISSPERSLLKSIPSQ